MGIWKYGIERGRREEMGGVEGCERCSERVVEWGRVLGCRIIVEEY
jgi:hypothetical protein